MAVDTRNKRGSCFGVGEPYNVVYPNPDGAALSVADRQQTAFSYASGDAGAPPAPSTGIKQLTLTVMFDI